MEIHQLRYFCAVVEAGSFTRAAASQGISQPSLSQQIVKLERELETPLFERLGRKVALTETGQALLPQALEILRQWNQVPSIVSSARDGMGGRLRIGCIPTVMPYYLAPKIGEFAALFPDVNVQLTEARTAELVDKVNAGELDMAIVTLPVASPDIVCSELFREAILVAVPEGHRLGGAPRVKLAEVVTERLLLLKEGHCFRENALTVCSRARAPFVSVFETDQFSSIFSLIGANFGISLIPQMAARPENGCRFLPLDTPALRRIGYMRARHHVASAVQKAFVKWLRGLRPA